MKRVVPGLLAATSTTALGDGISRSLVPLLAVAVSSSPGTVGVVQAVARLPWLLLSLPAGQSADRFGHRKTADVSLALKILGCAFLIVAATTQSTAALLVGAFIVVAGEVGFDVSVHTGLAVHVVPTRRAKENSRLYAVQTVGGQFIGPGLSGPLFSFGSAFAPAVPAVLHAISWIGWRLVDPSTPSRKPHEFSFRGSLATGFRSLWSLPALRSTTIISSIGMLAYGMWSAVFVTFVTGSDGLGGSPVLFGVLMACPAVGTVVASMISARVIARFSAFAGVVLFLIGQVGLYMPPALLAPAWVVAAGVILYGAGLAFWSAGVLSYRQKRIPTDSYGRATAAYRVVSWGASPIGALLGAALVGHGIQLCFAVCVVLVVLQVFFLTGTKELRQYWGND